MTARHLLVTGGAGYVGSHVCVELLARGYELVILDSLANSKIEVLSRIRAISGKRVTFVHADARDYARLQAIFRDFSIGAVLHFAGLKAVGESVREPIRYYRNNVDSATTLCAPTPNGAFAPCVISIRSGRTRAARSEKIRTASRAT